MGSLLEVRAWIHFTCFVTRIICIRAFSPLRCWLSSREWIFCLCAWLAATDQHNDANYLVSPALELQCLLECLLMKRNIDVSLDNTSLYLLFPVIQCYVFQQDYAHCTHIHILGLLDILDRHLFWKIIQTIGHTLFENGIGTFRQNLYCRYIHSNGIILRYSVLDKWYDQGANDCCRAIAALVAVDC